MHLNRQTGKNKANRQQRKKENKNIRKERNMGKTQEGGKTRRIKKAENLILTTNVERILAATSF